MPPKYVHLLFNPALGYGLFPCASINALLINAKAVANCSHCHKDLEDAFFVATLDGKARAALSATSECVYCSSCGTIFLSQQDLDSITEVVVTAK